MARPTVPSFLIGGAAAALTYLIFWGAFSTVLASSATYSSVGDAEANAEILAYLRAPIFTDASLALPDPERSHIADVKRLLDWSLVLAFASLGFLIGLAAILFREKRREEMLERALRAAGWSTLGVVVFLALGSLLDFSALFAIFHAVLFPQGNWMFPAGSVLIRTYPEAFFFRFALTWLGYAVTAGAMLLGLGLWLQHARRHEHEFRRQT